jgi:hypothetical protein
MRKLKTAQFSGGLMYLSYKVRVERALGSTSRLVKLSIFFTSDGILESGMIWFWLSLRN